MKVILSRKGFDSSNGGCPSPVLPDGTMISMPIPDASGKDIVCRFDELRFPGGKSYASVWDDLYPKHTKIETCHLDPDIRQNAKTAKPQGWLPTFGQTAAAQRHLDNNGIQIGDLFLFFGWFRKTTYCEDRLTYIKNEPGFHAIYGYLQIGEILKGSDVRKCTWHPHADNWRILEKGSNNTIYIASKNLSVGGKSTELPGAGVFPFSEKRVLTLPNSSTRTHWKLNQVFECVPLTYHSEKSIKDDYFQSACRGQEFVFSEDPRVIKWIEEILKD